MLFNSYHFLIFFPLVVAFYFSMPHKYRWVLLLAASYYFYMAWRAEYIFLIIFSTLIDYYAAIFMEKQTDKSKRKKFLILSLFSNLGLLFTFKYFNFFSTSISETFNYFNIFYESPTFKLLLPVGISFYTFQTLSYTIDVYRGQKKAEKHLGYFAVFVSFFPQLVAGPIERSTNLLPQFFEKHEFDYQRVTDGLKLMMWGFFKKVVIADRLAILVNQVYNNATEYEGFPLILATYFFTFQVYCDFSGYSDIAIGAAQVMGFDLMENFRRPFHAKSVDEFWKRWHISLSTWFRDYVYIPLGGNRVVKWRWYVNLFLTFLVSGLWHGANWTFVIWGSFHGMMILLSIWTKVYVDKIYNIIGFRKGTFRRNFTEWIWTFHLIVFSMLLFRANSTSDILHIINNMFVFNFTEFFNMISSTGAAQAYLGLTKKGIILAILSIIFMEFIHAIQSKEQMRSFLARKPIAFRWAAYIFILISIISFGEFNMKEFIYFQF